MKAYFIAGMAADKRVFKNIELPTGFEPVYLDWITPEREESLVSYAIRMAALIDTTEPFVLIGLSFGGMLATEIAKQYPAASTILISSIPVSAQLPAYFRTAARLRLHKYVPVSVIKAGAKARRIFSKTEDNKMLLQVIRESDDNLIRWTMHAILQWHNDIIPTSVVHIHGTSDEILPARYTQPTHFVAKGSHMMILTDAQAINAIIADVLSAVKI